MRNFRNGFISLITLLLCNLPLVSQAEALDSEQLAERLAELRIEYQQIDADITAMSQFMSRAKEDRASIDTLAKFLFRISVVAEEIERLSKKADALSLKGEAFAIDKMWATDTLKSTEALTAIPEGEAAYLYLSFHMPNTLEAVDISLSVTDLKSGKEVTKLKRTRPRKGDKNTQRTGIKIEASDLQLGASYEWRVDLTGADGKIISKKLRFGYGQAVIPLDAITLIATDSETGQSIGSDIADDVSVRLEATVPLIEEGEGEITWQLTGPDGKTIESAEQVESFSEAGGSKTSLFELQRQALSPGQYTVSVMHTLKGNGKSKTEATMAFNVLGALTIHKLAVSNSKKGDIASGTLRAGDLPHLYIHYTALKPVEAGSLRVYDTKSGKDYYSSDITQRVKADQKPHRIGTRLSADLLPMDRDVIFEVNFTDLKGTAFSEQRTFRINRHKLNVKLAKKLKSGKDYAFSIEPPTGFVSPYTVNHAPKNLIVHESRNDPLTGYVTGITEKKKAVAGLKIELTDAQGKVASTRLNLVVVGKKVPPPTIKSRPAVVSSKGGSTTCGVDTSRGGWTVKQLKRSIRLERKHPSWPNHKYSHQIYFTKECFKKSERIPNSSDTHQYRSWYSTGQKKSEGVYGPGRSVSFKQWALSTGKIIKKNDYDALTGNGEYLELHKNGKPRQREVYKNHKGKLYQYDENGRLYRTVDM